MMVCISFVKPNYSQNTLAPVPTMEILAMAFPGLSPAKYMTFGRSGCFVKFNMYMPDTLQYIELFKHALSWMRAHAVPSARLWKFCQDVVFPSYPYISPTCRQYRSTWTQWFQWWWSSWSYDGTWCIAPYSSQRQPGHHWSEPSKLVCQYNCNSVSIKKKIWFLGSREIRKQEERWVCKPL